MNDQELQTEIMDAAPPPSANRGMVQAGNIAARSQMMVRPRQFDRVKQLVVQEATAAGTAFFYDWGAGQNRVSGPSQELAFSLARIWGNCVVENGPATEHHDSWEIPATFVDLETGFTMTRSYLQSKHWTVHGKMEPERKTAARFGMGQSKAARNVVLKSLPTSLINAAVEAARSGVREAVTKEIKASDLKTVIRSYWSQLRDRHKITNDRILARFGYAKASAMTAEDVVTMRADLHQLDNGQEFPESLYPEPEKTSEDLTEDIKGEPEAKPETPKKKPGRPKKKPAQKKPTRPADPVAERTAEFLKGAEVSLSGVPSAFEVDVVLEEILAEIDDAFGTELDQNTVKEKVRALAKKCRAEKEA